MATAIAPARRVIINRITAELGLGSRQNFRIVGTVDVASGDALAFGKGGALETVRGGVTGVFFKDASAESLIQAVETARNTAWDSRQIREHALGFSKENFISRLKVFFDKITLS